MNPYKIISYDFGKTEHYYNDKLHNDHGPAIVCQGYPSDPRGYEDKLVYYKHGIIHREDGPAIITNSNKNNFKLEWYFEGKKHRENGPAVIEGNGNIEYWLNDIKINN